MPYKANESRRHKVPKARYRVENWSDYDAALRRRGDLTLWMTPEAIAAWTPPATGRRGRSSPVRVNANETAGLGVQARSACVISGASELVAASVCLQDAGGLRSRKALPSRPSGRVPREGPCPPSRAPAWGKAGRDGGMAAPQPNNGMTGMGISSPSGRPAG